jgi:5-formyltetrahydrofolate cyclo-ligase
VALSVSVATPTDVFARKQAVRERIWRRLEDQGAARFPGARGRIPNFVGAQAAADRLATSPAWQHAAVVKVNPDAPQLPVRARALADGKLLYMAVPRLATAKPFLRLDPTRVGRPRAAASIKGAARLGTPVTLGDMEKIDLVICGSVAVNRAGARVGKGGGYSDLEFALLLESSRLDGSTVLATTVHPLQLEDEELPETYHDFRVDLIVTPTDTVTVRAPKRPPGLIWEHLAPDMLEAIPVLRELA